ncbi:unnamed protein product [Adineta steineri]|uniref:NAD(P)(+)--arginine ADP-ribosyltransferase n=1 Tax=Adineta steineri TaxID=433720 RepID=A0A814LDI5_9BILA|nr:unnamed protein product [Adineta steineri]CAF1169322.1 unnamed protein product [Adineta steineri]
MDVRSLPDRQINNVADEDKSDSFTLIWLDQNCGEDHIDSLQTKVLLKQIDDKCLFYNNIDEFCNDLEKNHTFEKNFLLIVSGSYAKILLNKFRDKRLPLIIFCKKYDEYKKHLNQPYIIDICTDYNSLKVSIERFGLSLKSNLLENRRLNTILTLRTTSYNNTNTLYSYILFIEILKQSSNIIQAKDSMVKQIKNYFRHNPTQTSYIEIFDNSYKSDDAIEWYTKETFVYPLINKAFRTEDSAIWYTFRFYISDLCKQIEEVHRQQNKKEQFIVYRGQSRLPRREFHNITSNCGGLISCNGYFSTSKSFDIAKIFISDATDTEDFHVVIFEITVNANELKHTIFVDINQFLDKDNPEEEILFNIGTVFKIDSYQKEEEFWRIRMHVSDECIMDIKQRIEPILKKLSTININLFLGKLLIDMHQYDKAESYFNMNLRNLPNPKHADRPLIDEYLGDLQMRMNNYNSAFEYFQSSYKEKEKIISTDDPNMFITYNHLGNYYKATGDLKTAEEYYNKMLDHGKSPVNIAITKLNLATISFLKKKYSKAQQMCFDAREIFHQFQPIPYGDILACQGVLGDIYFQKKQYDIAESFYLVAFEMGKKYLSIGDPRLIHCVYALADVYHKQNKQTCAIIFCQEQLTIHEKYLSNPEHISIGQILLKMGDLSNDTYYYRKAMIIFNNNIRYDYLSTAKCLMKLAELDKNDQSNIQQALEIYRKIYPPKHTILIKTEKELMKLEKRKKMRKNTVEKNSSEPTANRNDQEDQEDQEDDDVLLDSNQNDQEEDDVLLDSNRNDKKCRRDKLSYIKII